MEQSNSETRKPLSQGNDRRIGSQVLVTFSTFAEVEPVMQALADENISFFPRTYDGCAETSVDVGGYRYIGVQEILGNIQDIAEAVEA